MWSAPKTCGAAGCSKPSVQGSAYCEAHAKEPPKQTRLSRVVDPVRRLYDTARWKRFRLWILSQRPICQRLIKGARCQEPTNTVHHIRSPRNRPDLFTDPKNVLALCANCHPGGTEDTPDWLPGWDYVDEKARGWGYEE